MKITFIGTDLSLNEVGRTYLLAKVLSRNHEVEIVGLTSLIGGYDIWPPVDNGEIVYKPIRASYTYPGFLRAIPKVFEAITGDLVYAQSLQVPSFGLALLYRAKHKTPVILDNVDWEFPRSTGTPHWTHYIRGNRHVRSPFHRWLMEKLISRADAVTCSNLFLQKMFGGEIIVHGKDTTLFDPSLHDPSKSKAQHGLLGKEVILFLGTPRPHKGLDDLIEAVKRLDRKNTVLLIVGADFGDPITSTLKALGSSIDLRFTGIKPFLEIPSILAMADVIAIPQQETLYSMGQLPAKLFDAMAMACPIISTRVSDIEEILNGCGWVVDPNSPSQLAEAIEYVLDHPIVAETMGRKAREKCISNYNWDCMALQMERTLRVATSKRLEA